MSQINDAVLAATGGPTINDGLLVFYQDNGATSNSLNDAEAEFLIAAGATPAQLNDMWFELLRDAGFTGALNDMLLYFWSVGGVFAPLAFLQMGGSPSRAETPDSVLNSITGDIDMRVLATADNWQETTERTLISKFNATGNNRQWRFRKASGGILQVQSSPNGVGGGSVVTSSATVPLSFAPNTKHWVRGTHNVTTNVSNFFTSVDGVVWDQLGDADVPHVSGGIFDGTSIWEVGGTNNGTTARWVGRIHRAIVLDGIEGTDAVDFDPTGRAGLLTWTGSLGETWDVFPPASIVAGA